MAQFYYKRLRGRLGHAHAYHAEPYPLPSTRDHYQAKDRLRRDIHVLDEDVGVFVNLSLQSL
jgi:hypothetical protein